MKLSMAVSTPDAEFSALALKGDYDRIFSLLKDCGYDGAELAVRDPDIVDLDTIKKLSRKYHLYIPAVGTGRAFGEDGLCFSSENEEIRRKAVERIKKHIDFCAELNSLVIIGLIVGKTEYSVRSIELASACLSDCAGYASVRNVELVVEPINRYESGFITNVDTCLDFLDRVGHNNCKVLFDTFHANIEEASITGSIRKAGERIGHVHVADSNRHHAGAGHTDFTAILNELHDIGYTGWLSAEILPEPDPETAVRRNASFLNKLIGH